MLTYPPDMYENKTSVDPEWRDTIFYFVANKTLENCRSTIDDALKVHGNVHHGKDGDTVTASSDCPAVILTPTNLGDKSVCPKVKVELEKKNFPADGLTFTTPSYYPQKTAALEPFTVRSQSDVNDLVRSVITVVPVKAGTTATEAVKISSDPSATPGTCEISRTLVENVPSRGNVINNPIFNSALLTYTITVGKSNETKPKPVPLPIHLSVPTLDSKLDLKLDFNNNAKGSLTSFDMNLVSEISFRQPKELKFVYTPVVNDNKTLDIEWRLEAETPLPTVAPPSCGTPSGEVTTMSTTTTTRGGVPNEVISAVLLIASIVYAFGSN
ncbi:hypothetical protein L596_020125 [Steinernema carpocapsae]|uniref:Uncharacterized protein n=1 Tax=Steinernema carpocapsae TaxID=34508 RepID=A0A4U5MST8_STECR|nr:hypothetical protein L596_020125 [Steinernema carpocapsae]